MEFWGVEVKAGKPHKVLPEEGRIIHLSQASLGESKGKTDNSVPLYVTFKGQKIVLGTLSADKFPQIPFDLVFEGEFEVSHNWKSGSVYLLGYTASSEDFGNPEDSELSDDEESEGEDIPLAAPENGKLKPPANANAEAVKPAPSANKVAAEPKEVKIKDADDVDMDDDDDDDEDSEEGSGSDDKDGGDSSEDNDDEEDGSDEDDEETPKKAASGKKRLNDCAAVTPVPSKKAKSAASAHQKTDGKKGGHTATPHPAKQTGKGPVKSPQSGGHTCKSCSKTFNSENALQSHAKAKHK